MFDTAVNQTGRVLDFDIETRRIGFHSAGRFAPDGCEAIAIAWAYTDDKQVSVIVQGQTWDRGTVRSMLRHFLDVYDAADLVTGHYIRKFDLPILSGMAMEHGLQWPGAKLTSDTKLDLIQSAGLSKSQENLSALYDLEASKFSMNDNAWRKAARLTAEGRRATVQRVHDDVLQHMELRATLLQHGLLAPPRMWSP